MAALVGHAAESTYASQGRDIRLSDTAALCVLAGSYKTIVFFYSMYYSLKASGVLSLDSSSWRTWLAKHIYMLFPTSYD